MNEMSKTIATPGADGKHVTFCRICEALCGMVATVKDGKVVKLEPDRDNPHSQGHVCVKGIAMAEVNNDPDRVTTPLRRTGAPGEFEPVSCVRRQNIWHNSRRRIAECGPRLGLMFRRRACGVASADVRVSFA